MAVLPQILILEDTIIEKTSFELNHINLTPQSYSGTVRVQGLVKGHVNGTLEGSFNGIVKGDMEVLVISGQAAVVDSENLLEEKQKGSETNDRQI